MVAQTGLDRINYSTVFLIKICAMEQQSLTPQQAIPKIKNYCAYQERCHSEVRDKLYSFGLHKADVEAIISNLIEENYLNEERFAILFAGGKFRIKQWGRIKIRYELKQKQVSDYCIKKALASIDEGDYMKTFNKLVELQLKRLRTEKNMYTKKRKLIDSMKAKGFEAGLMNAAIAKLKDK
jgi:regulatory protein